MQEDSLTLTNQIQSQTSTFRSCSSSIPKHKSLLSMKKPMRIFRSDFFAPPINSNTSEDQSSFQFKSQPNQHQPLLQSYANVHVQSTYHNKIIVNIEKEIDEDKELLDLLEGKDENPPRPSSVEPYNKVNANTTHININTKQYPMKTSLLKQSKCEIIPEVDEDKMKTMTKISPVMTCSNKDEVKEENIHYSNTNIYTNNNIALCGMHTKRQEGIKLAEWNNNNNNNYDNDLIKSLDSPKAMTKRKIIKRFSSVETKQGTRIATTFDSNKLILPVLGNSLNLHLFESKVNYIKKLIYNSLENICPEKGEFQASILDKISNKNSPDNKSLYSKKTINRSKVSSAPTHLSKVSAHLLSSSTKMHENINLNININSINANGINDNNTESNERKIQQFSRKNRIRSRHNPNLQLVSFLASNSESLKGCKLIQIGPKNQTPYQRYNKEGLLKFINQHL